MATKQRADLKRIRTFPSLVAYLRDELGWPIDATDFDELTFDYTPEELGIDSANAAKIQEIKRLRPLSTNQPWGVFFVKFEPKKLPVVALRRILNGVVLKKRASANSAERAAWAVDDLLFISNYGTGAERQLSFAHFSQEKEKADLPTLKVLGWDSSDTPLHLDDVAGILTDKLAWPTDESDAEAWRESWRAAFTLSHREVITTAKALALTLAELARSIRERIETVLEIETEDGPVTRLMEAFQEALIHDLDARGFADMYAQTIAYGLLSARITDPKSSTADDLAAHMRTNPFLKDLMETFLNVGGDKQDGRTGAARSLDFDELGAAEVIEVLDAANMEAVVRDFGDRNPQEDPVIHFYESFLKEYDAKRRMQLGVFFTPRQVVSYIVRSVHETLQSEFGLADGLADTATWGDMMERHRALTLPKGVRPTDRFVTILDPATGTGTFLVEAIDVIYRTLFDKWAREGHNEEERLDLWNVYVAEELLPRLHGYELLMAPYAIAHLKIGLKLYETGYRFESNERARVYLTNALEAAHDYSDRLGFAVPALAHEAKAVNAVKDMQHFTVFVANPPYSVLSGNLSPEARELVDAYRSVDGERIQEKSMLRLEMHLQDDYIKFFRIAENAVHNSRCGIVGLITNSSYLNSLSLRGMRGSLLNTFDHISLLNLHGSQQRATEFTRAAGDQNVFDIVQGVAIFIGSNSRSKTEMPEVRYADLVGDRMSKYNALSESSAYTIRAEGIRPAFPSYYLEPVDHDREEEFNAGYAVTDLFNKRVTGMVTAHDHLVIDFDDKRLRSITRVLRDRSKADAEVRQSLAVKDNAGWKLAKARKHLLETKDGRHWYKDIDYRPFDRRRINYHPALVWSDRRELMQNLQGPDNVALSTCRQLSAPPWSHVLVGRSMVESAFVSNKSREICHVMPLWLFQPGDGLSEGQPTKDSNLSPVAQTLADKGGRRSPESLLNYLYAQLHSPTYRSRYADFLKRDFPRVFMPRSDDLFNQLERVGAELIALHLIEAASQQGVSASYDKAAGTWRFELATQQSCPVALSFSGPQRPVVSSVGWADETVWLDAVRSKGNRNRVSGTVGFHGVAEEVWKFRIGAYQVCKKWLKDRGPKRGQPARRLNADDIAHYHRIVIALSETIRMMGKIDDIINEHGGWPDAFETDATRGKPSRGETSLMASQPLDARREPADRSA